LQEKEGLEIVEPENPGLEVAKAFAGEVGKESVGKFAEFMGEFFPFWGLKKKAVNAYVHDIEQSNLPPETKMMAIANTKKTFREMQNQQDVVDIASAVIDYESQDSIDASENVDYELVARLIDGAKFVTDEGTKLLWGNVLAGEFEHPGSTPRSVIRILSELSHKNALFFSQLCSLRVNAVGDTGKEIRDFGPELMIGPWSGSYLKGLGNDKCEELAKIGLINYSMVGEYSRPILSTVYPYVHLVSGDHVITIYNTGELPCGIACLNDAGKCIARYIPSHHNPLHMEAIKSYLMDHNIKISSKPGIAIKSTKAIGEMRMEYNYERREIEPPQMRVSR